MRPGESTAVRACPEAGRSPELLAHARSTFASTDGPMEVHYGAVTAEGDRVAVVARARILALSMGEATPTTSWCRVIWSIPTRSGRSTVSATIRAKRRTRRYRSRFMIRRTAAWHVAPHTPHSTIRVRARMPHRAAVSNCARCCSSRRRPSLHIELLRSALCTILAAGVAEAAAVQQQVLLGKHRIAVLTIASRGLFSASMAAVTTGNFTRRLPAVRLRSLATLASLRCACAPL